MQKSKLTDISNFGIKILKRFPVAVLAGVLFLMFAPIVHGATDLKISGNGHYIETSGGSPFLYLADTEWLLNEHSDTQIGTLLDDRQTKGFTVIQTIAPRNWGGETDYNGNYPFVSNNVTQLNAAYWNRIKWIADQCSARNLYLAIHIGDPGRMEGSWYAHSNSEAYEYGRQIGITFQGKTNIIFNIGEDDPGNYGVGVDGWRAIAEGVADGVNGANNYDGSADYSTTFMTFHPNGLSPFTSSAWFHSDSWLDVNGMEVWGNNGGVYAVVHGDYSRTNPVKPTLVVEGSYEAGDYTSGPYPENPVTPHYVRVEAWHTYFAGGAGYGYGHYNNWSQYANVDYISSTGAQQMKVLKDFMNAREWWKFVPDQGILSAGEGSGNTRKAAVKSTDGDECYVYYPTIASANIKMNCITTSSNVNATWFDPRNGNTQSIGSYATSQTVNLTPPSGWEDAVLLLTQASATPFCGDSSCNNGETCSTCSADCGTCTIPPLSGWTACATENQQCSFSGTKQVQYGGNSQYFSGTFTNGVLCANSVFGDPIINASKYCYYRNVTQDTTAPAAPRGLAVQ